MILNCRNTPNACNGITSEFGAYFVLRIGKILSKDKYHKTILNGAKASGFSPLPVDYSYRDSKNFWIARRKKPYAETVQAKAHDVKLILPEHMDQINNKHANKK